MCPCDSMCVCVCAVKSANYRVENDCNRTGDDGRLWTNCEVNRKLQYRVCHSEIELEIEREWGGSQEPHLSIKSPHEKERIFKCITTFSVITAHFL